LIEQDVQQSAFLTGGPLPDGDLQQQLPEGVK